MKIKKKFNKNISVRDIFESIDHPICIINPSDHTVEYGNTASGFKSGSKKHVKCYQLNHGYKKPCTGLHKCPIRIMKETKKSLMVQHIHLDENKNERIYELYAHPILNQDGDLDKVVEYSFDVTDKMNNQNKYKILFESSRDAIMTLEPPTWNFTSGNKAVIEMFEAKDEKDFISRGPGDYSLVMQPDGQPSADKAKAMIMQAMENGSNFFEWDHMRINGEVFPATVLLTKVKIGKKEYLQATVRDVTEQKEQEKRMNELDQLKSRFITALIHVARTPLNEIRWGFEMLISGDFGKLSNEQIMFLRKILKSEESVLNLITNMNIVLDLERKTLIYEKAQTSLLSLVKSVVNENLGECKIKELICKVESPKVNLKAIAIDPTKIRLAIKLLLDNAIRYSKDKGEIIVNFSISKNYFTVNISDQGIGIPQEEQANIFERFYRASNAQSMYADGVGLGLYIVKSIIDGHEGKVDFVSREGEGATFCVSLPIMSK